MRHRERNGLFPLFTSSYSRQPGDSYSETVWREDVGLRKTIDDCVFPGARSVINKGGVLPVQPVIIDSRDIQVTPLVGELRNISPPFVVSYGSHVGAAISPYLVQASVPERDDSVVSYVVNAAIQKSKMGSWDALTSLAEAKKTVIGIADRVNKVFNFATAGARAARRLRKNATGRIALFEEYWLEARYQWRPLLKEIDDLTNHLQKGSQVRQVGRSSASEALSVSLTPPNVVAGPRIWRRSSRLQGTRTYRGFALSIGDISSVNLSIPQTAWELVPYSFVVDKFIAIGSAINAWTPIPGVDTPASGFSIHDSYTIIDEVEALDNPAVADTIASYSPYRRVTTVNHYHRWSSGAMIPRLYPRLKPADLMDILLLTTSRARRISNLLR